MLRTVIRQPVRLGRIRRPCRRLFFTFEPSETFMSIPFDQNSVPGWMQSNRLYESCLFFYVLILVFWAAAGFVTLGFELPGFSPQGNLLWNFLWFLVLAAAMAATPLWYRLMFRRSMAQKQAEWEEEAGNYLLRFPRQERAEIYQVLRRLRADQGDLPPGRLQVWALVFLGWIALFELFFVSAWVKDLQLVWHPAWAEAAIDWVRRHTNTPPIHIDRKLFWLTFETTRIPLELRTGSEQEFMRSAFGQVVLLGFFFRYLLFFPMLISTGIVLWRPLDWARISRIDPRHIRTVRQFLWSSFLSFFTTFMILSYGMFITDVDYRATDLISKWAWLNGFWLHILQIFILCGVKMLVGWLVFWRRVVVSLFNRIRS